MEVVCSIISLEEKLEDLVITYMFLSYDWNYEYVTCGILNIYTKNIVQIHDLICMNITYGKYASRQKHTKADSYILPDEDKYNNWDNNEIDTVKTEIFNIRKNVRNKQYYKGE